MKTVGIIGGLGPETTSEFYSEVIFQCKKLNNYSYPSIIINSIPLPFKIEENAMAYGIEEEKCLPYLVKAAKSLERAGADFIVLTCNSLHKFIKEVRSAVRVPVLSISEETSKFLKQQNIEKVGIVATPITINSKLYVKPFKTKNITLVIPDALHQAKIGKLIHKIVSNRYENRDRQLLTTIIQGFAKKKVKNVILACTDLQLLLPEYPGIKIYDTMRILIDATVRKINT